MTYRKRVSIQLAYPFSEDRLFNRGQFPFHWKPPYLIQPKLNGERCRLIVSEGRTLLLSSTDEIIPSIPHINASALSLPQGEYDGELYTHGLSWSEIHSIVSRQINLHHSYTEMELHLFDLITPLSQAERLWDLGQCFHHPVPYIKQVPTYMVNTLDEITKLYDTFISDGYEGFILRDINAPYVPKRSPWMMKFKPKKRDTYPISSIIEAISESGTPMGMVGAFQCLDDMGTLFKVGAGHLTHKERKDLWTQWQDNAITPEAKLEIEFQTLSDKAKVPLFSRALKVLKS